MLFNMRNLLLQSGKSYANTYICEATFQRNETIMTVLRFTWSLCVVLGLALPAMAADDQPSEEELKGLAAKEVATAKSLIYAERYKRAIGHLNKAREADGRNPDIHNYLGYAYRKLGKNDAAMTSYNKALKLDPNHKGALEYQGELFLTLKMPEKAKQHLEKLKTLCPNGCEELELLKKSIAKYGG